MTSGLLLIDKPAGVTSHAVVSFVRKALGISRVGHLGTLDPFASGLLPILVGGFTRMSDELMEGDKGYLFTIQFGSETDTLDPQGTVIASSPLAETLSLVQIEGALEKLRGKIFQTPPAYSALKHKGRPLYEYMRTQGKLDFDIVEKRREVFIRSLVVSKSEEYLTTDTLTLHCICSKGTYIRCLARDIAIELQTRGYCLALRRTHVGPWRVEDALQLSLEDLKTGKSGSHWNALLTQRIRTAAEVFPEYPVVHVPSTEEKICLRLASGNPVEITSAQYFEWAGAPSSLQLQHQSQRQKAFVSTEKVLFYAEVFAAHQGSECFSLIPQKQIAQY